MSMDKRLSLISGIVVGKVPWKLKDHVIRRWALLESRIANQFNSIEMLLPDEKVVF